MSNNAITLKDILEATGDEWTSESKRKGIEAESKLISLKEDITSKHKGLIWNSISDMIIEKVGSLLETDIKEILLAAWKKSEEIIKYLDETSSSGKTKDVALAEHIIKSNHNPKLEVLLNEKSIGEILFHIQLALKLEGFILKIQGGNIYEMKAGVCHGSGIFKCEDFVILEKKTGPIQLPGSLTF